MDAFEYNKFNEDAFFKLMLSNAVIVSYGFITAVDYNTVEVALAVSSSNFADKVSCTFMNIGNEQFALALKPVVNMRVVVLSPNKAANGMYESYTQLKAKEGRGYIRTNTPAVYSSQQAFCFPLMKSTAQALSSLLVDNAGMSLEVAHSLTASINGMIDLHINKDTLIELQEGTKHIRNCEGDLEETFGMVQGIGGAEKPGTYVYKETYGKFSSVEKNYESGAVINVGKTFEKPFLENKGAAVDSSAPVTLVFGKNAPVNFTASAPVTLNLSGTTPVTLNFGGTAVSIKVDKTTGLDIKVTGSAPVKIMAETGLVKIGNGAGTVATILNDILTLLDSFITVGSPTTQSIGPASKALVVAAKAKLPTIFE